VYCIWCCVFQLLPQDKRMTLEAAESRLNKGSAELAAAQTALSAADAAADNKQQAATAAAAAAAEKVCGSCCKAA